VIRDIRPIRIISFLDEYEKLCKIIELGEIHLKLTAVATVFLLSPFFLFRTEAVEIKTTGLCESTESIIFSCSTKNGKLLSVCSKLNAPKVSKVQYRFGKVNQVELTLPRTNSDSISYNSVMYSGGGGAYVRFKHGDTDYVVFSKIVKGEGESSGVLIQKKGKKSAQVRCEVEGDVDLALLQKLQLKKESDDIDPLIED
jgi:hypothetical protein